MTKVTVTEMGIESAVFPATQEATKPATRALSAYEIGLMGDNATLREVNRELVAALEGLLTYDRVERPAFRAKPEGAPNSSIRIRQEKLIALEDQSIAVLAKAKETPWNTQSTIVLPARSSSPNAVMK